MVAAKMYCLRCKRKVACKSAKLGRDRRGRARLSGHCPHCDCKMFRYVKEQ
jgi:hypothetical protein